MRKRIEELAEGKFLYEQPQVSFSKDTLEIEVIEGQTAEESFQIKSENKIWMRGVVYSSDARMECLTPKYEGLEAAIRVQFHADGMTEGETMSGTFCVVCTGGEYKLKYTVSVTRLYAEASTGKIKNLKDFTRLAQTEWKEAYYIFHSPAFKNILPPKALKAALLYNGLTRHTMTEQTMEEFLIGAGKKERIRFSLDKHSCEIFEVGERAEEEILIQKEGWGYLEIRVSSSEEFLVPQKRFLTEEDFMGSSLPFLFYVDAEKMHAGNNFGCIYFENDVQKEEYHVWASTDSIEEKKERNYLEIQRARYALVKNYIDYRLRKMVTGEWTKQTVALLQKLEDCGEADEWYLLFRAYALQCNRQFQDSEWLMDDFRKKFKDKRKPQWAFYDYLCLLREKESVVIEQLLTEIELITRRYSSHPMMFYLTLRLNSVLRAKPQVKLRAIHERILGGQVTQLWYVEAYLIYKERPYFLTKLEQAEILILNWASRKGILTKDLADQTIRLANNMRRYQQTVCRILFRCYHAFPDEDTLAGVCAYLLKGQRFLPKYHHWYEMGIKENLKITGLYEAYLLTMDLHNVQPLPKVIQIYFQYNNQLAYQYKAALYVNIIAHKKEQPLMYEKYSETIKQFAIDEIMQGHMDDNLAVIYEEMLDKGILTSELAASLSDILYTHKFYCMNESAAFVVVIQKHMKEEQRVPLSKGTAYFQIFSGDYAVLLEDNKGQRFVAPEVCQMEKLMKPSHYIRRCLHLAPEKLQYLMHHMDGKTDLSVPVKSDVEYLRILMAAPQISDKFKNQIGPGLIRYCLINHEEENLEEYFTQINFAGLSRDHRNILIELMVEQGYNEKAYELVSSYGYQGIDLQHLSQLVTYMLRTRDIGEDPFLLEMCLAAVLAGMKNSTIVSYLAKYYEGPTGQMLSVYRAAQACEIVDVTDLEERILVQSLYSTQCSDEILDVYEAYHEHHGREFILQAYRSYCMHRYVVYDKPLEAPLFFEAYQLQKEGKLRGLICRLGLLKRLCEVSAVTPLDRYQIREADVLLGEFISKNLNFGFFRKLPEPLCAKYQLYNRVLVEYHARPDSQLQIHYRMINEQTGFITKDMPGFEGIFTWELLLFRDDEVEYYITEKQADGTSRLLESNRVTGVEYRDVKNGGRFAYINCMMYLREQENYKELIQTMLEYEKLEILTEKIFRII